MDKNAIKKYAVWARNELIARVSQKALLYGITKNNIVDAAMDSINGKLLTDTEKRQRQALIAQIKEKGFEQVMEEVAYTWFNRFSALRFMEVNGYLPSHVRVFTDEENNFKPQIITEAIHLEMDGLDMEKVYDFKEADKTEELYKYLLITQCNALNKILPGMFQCISDYTELLLPDNLLREGSVIQRIIAEIPEEDWKDAVQIIGWLYQYYNIESFDIIYDGDMSRNKVTKELIPAATQIFTPDWVVRYMVENSLGRLWLEGHPNDELKSNWKYYLDEAEQEAAVQTQLAKIRKEYEGLTPKDIHCIDPCSGSGHILAYMFDVLVKIYEDYGYSTREAVSSIVENNIYGLDIDDRAAQLAGFAVMMKARQYDRLFFSRGIQPHVYAIVESNHVDSYIVDYFCNGDTALKKAMNIIIDEMQDAKEYGSLLKITHQNWTDLYARFEEIKNDINIARDLTLEQLLPMVQVAEILSQKYQVACTNPPYLGNSRYNSALGEFVKKNYPDEKADLAMSMLNRVLWGFTKKNYFTAAITTVSWMYLKSFEKFRMKVINSSDFVCIADFGTELFEGKIGHLPVASWISRNSSINQQITSIRLVDYCYSRKDEKLTEFFEARNRYNTTQKDFLKIPGAPVAYWARKEIIHAFETGTLIDDIASVKIGMGTGKNAIFVREWWEVDFASIDFNVHSIDSIDESKGKYFPYNKGGEYRRWYGNLQEVVWYNAEGRKKMFSMSGHRENGGRDGYFKQGITWNFIGTSKFSVRLMPTGCLFDVAGSALFVEKASTEYILGFLSSIVCNEILKLLNPTVNYQAGNVKSLPIIVERESEVNALVRENVELCKKDWNLFETAWEFGAHPLIRQVTTVAEAFAQLDDECNLRFARVKSNEEKLNNSFINIYGLEEELSAKVEDKDVSVSHADLQREIKSLISYAVGCMFGRYSLDVHGLAYAGGSWDATKYKTFPADKDNIIPICDDEYFQDDIVGHFVKFVETVYGDDTLEENLKFIADALGGKGSSRDVIRNYFINDFYANHCKMFQKCPIYWQFDSGKKNGFKCLIYMHRYREDTIARIRTDYVHEQQSRYRTAIADLEQRINDVSSSDRVKLNKQLTKLKDQESELRNYEEKIHHLADQMIRINLDDGVKNNYEIFNDVLAKIK